MKKNQFALLCLTAVIMLAVWYIKSPLNNVSGNVDDSVVVNGESSRLDALKLMREALREERSIQVAALDTIIASESTTIAQKNSAINEKQTISDTTEREVIMELSIINLGYTDAFVHQTSSGVDILVIAYSLSETEVVTIMNLTYSSFTTDTVIVSYKSASEFK
jgi:hypothetical protein